MNEEETKKLEAARQARQNHNDERIKMMEAIADSQDMSREEEVQEDEQENKQEAKQEEEDRAAAETAKKLQQEGSPEVKTEHVPTESDERVVNGETHYRMIVNGVERWKTLKEIRASAQKVDSADEYLHQASESVRNASRLALSHKDEPSRLKKDEFVELLRRQALGEEEAIEKLASFYGQLSDTDVTQQIDQRLSLRTELAQLEDEQRDILAKPSLRKLFNLRLQEMKQENATTPLSVAYRQIGKELRDEFTIISKTPLEDKLERKRTMVNAPAAGARLAALPEDEDDVQGDIAAMAKARGFTPHIHTRRQ